MTIGSAHRKTGEYQGPFRFTASSTTQHPGSSSLIAADEKLLRE